MRLLFAILLSLGIVLPAQAKWYLDNESSRLSFISTKNLDTSEVHRFLTLHGTVSDSGEASLRVELESVSTGISLRDERMRSLLFDIAKFPQARVSAQLDIRPISTLAAGAQLELSLPLTLTLHGQSHSYRVELLATRLDDHRFQVVTLAPLVLNAADFDLLKGLDALRKVAGLSAISRSVPVGAVLIFTRR
ncbi:YceI family protein [Pseudomonas sp. S9]|uniref:YceI family protein n=1 Tax=Pseudomonas sp. S9 TaxID=686578 RepID=UPI00025573F9|nr:YceI family protein [Pseudomonas sp. S9]